MVVAFFGHANTPSTVYPMLESKIMKLAEQNREITFLVGTHGSFDSMVRRALKQAVKQYPYITCYVVLAYYDPTDKDGTEQYGLPTLFPEGIENTPPRFAIDFRNKYMVSKCDMVVCYVKHDWGGAWKYTQKAENQGKDVINLI